MKSDDSKRVFVAVNVPDVVLGCLRDIQNGLREQLKEADVAWTGISKMHVTLKFFENIPAAAVNELCEAISKASAGARAFMLSTGGLGVFPNEHRPRVIWVAIDGEEDVLEGLQSLIDSETADVRGPEPRVFNPHVTLGRIRRIGRDETNRLCSKIASKMERKKSWGVASIQLIESKLSPTGATCHILKEFPLGLTS